MRPGLGADSGSDRDSGSGPACSRRDGHLHGSGRPASHRPARKINWDNLVNASIEIDPALIGKGFQAVGLKKVGPSEFAIALNDRTPVRLLGPITLRSGQRTLVKLKTAPRPREVARLRAGLSNPVYHDITISQIRPDGARIAKDRAALFDPKRNLVVGGVSYTLQVPARRKPKRAVKRPKPGPTRTK